MEKRLRAFHFAIHIWGVGEVELAHTAEGHKNNWNTQADTALLSVADSRCCKFFNIPLLWRGSMYFLSVKYGHSDNDASFRLCKDWQLLPLSLGILSPHVRIMYIL